MSSGQPESMYSPAWRKLKKDGRIEIVAHPRLHARIIKAMQKRKWLDVAYKLELEPRKAIMTFSRQGNKIVFELYIQFSTRPEEDFV